MLFYFNFYMHFFPIGQTEIIFPLQLTGSLKINYKTLYKETISFSNFIFSDGLENVHYIRHKGCTFDDNEKNF